MLPQEIENIYRDVDNIADEQEKILFLIRTAWDIRRSYPKSALDLSFKAREISEENSFTEGIAYSYRNTGTAYYILSQYNLALNDLEIALGIFQTINNIHAIGSVLRNIGNVYHSMNLPEQAIGSYNKALEITEAENDLQGMAYNLGNIGYVYQKSGEYKKAKAYLFKGKEILEKINDTLGLSDLLNNLGNVVIEENLGQAEIYIQRSLELAISIDHLRGIAGSRLNLGQIHIRKKNNKEAISEFEKALKTAEVVGELLLITDVLKQIAVAYETAGNYQKALEYFKIYDIKKSELHKNDRKSLQETFKLKYEIEKTNLEKDELEKARNEIEQKNKELERLSIVARETENSILIMDADGTLEWVNASFERLNGCQIEEFKRRHGNTIYELSNNPDIKNIIQNCIDTKTSVHYESANTLDDGRVVWEASTLTPIFNDEGDLIKLIIIDDNITERKFNEELIKQKNKDITDSILYAKNLQEALLPPLNGLQDIFEESFIIFKPKDIVSGDFYWYSETPEVALMAVADCTGHGVPGAFMSVIGNEMLHLCLHDSSVRSPSAALDLLDKKIKEVFKKGRQQIETQDGMDIGIIVWHRENNFIQYSGAKRPLVHIRNKEIKEYGGDRFSIGGKDDSHEKHFTDKEFRVEPGDMLYLFSDGYADQFGGPNGKKFMHKKFLRLLSENSHLPLTVQKQKLEQALTDWQGSLEQVDDISVVGIRIT